jgi:hypothetical protein
MSDTPKGSAIRNINVANFYRITWLLSISLMRFTWYFIVGFFSALFVNSFLLAPLFSNRNDFYLSAAPPVGVFIVFGVVATLLHITRTEKTGIPTLTPKAGPDLDKDAMAFFRVLLGLPTASPRRPTAADQNTMPKPGDLFLVDVKIFIAIYAICAVIVAFANFSVAHLFFLLLSCALAYFPQVFIVQALIARRFKALTASADAEQLQYMMRYYRRYDTVVRNLSKDVDRIQATTEKDASHPNQDLKKGRQLERLLPWVGLLPFIAIIARFNQIPDGFRLSAGGLYIAIAAWISFRSPSKRMPTQEMVDREMAPNVERVRAADPRAPILYLRAFRDDQNFSSFENSLACLNNLGPLIALGSPRDDSSRLGSYRSYLDNAEWQHAVSSFMQAARMIFLVPATTDNVDWEIATIRDRGFLHKTALIFPDGLSGSDKRLRLASITKVVADQASALQTLDVDDTVIVHFFTPGFLTNIFTDVVRVGEWNRPLFVRTALAVAAADRFASEGRAAA